jgi:hypothetical protein
MFLTLFSLGYTTFSIKTVCITTFSIMAFSITTNKSRQSSGIMLNVVMQNVTNKSFMSSGIMLNVVVPLYWFILKYAFIT